MIAPFKVVNAFTTLPLTVLPNNLKESIDPAIPLIPCCKAIALCTFSIIFSTSFPSAPNKPIAPCNALNPAVAPCKAPPKATNFLSGLNVSANAFASPMASLRLATFFAALIASLDVSPN